MATEQGAGRPGGQENRQDHESLEKKEKMRTRSKESRVDTRGEEDDPCTERRGKSSSKTESYTISTTQWGPPKENIESLKKFRK